MANYTGQNPLLTLLQIKHLVLRIDNKCLYYFYDIERAKTILENLDIVHENKIPREVRKNILKEMETKGIKNNIRQVVEASKATTVVLNSKPRISCQKCDRCSSLSDIHCHIENLAEFRLSPPIFTLTMGLHLACSYATTTNAQEALNIFREMINFGLPFDRDDLIHRLREKIPPIPQEMVERLEKGLSIYD